MKAAVLALIMLTLPALGTAVRPYDLSHANLTPPRCAIAGLDNEVRGASAVFSGKVTSQAKTGDTRVFEFDVKIYWKGNVGKRIKVSVYETVRYQAWFEVGETYLVFARREDKGSLYVQRCSRSKLFTDADDDLKKLGAGKRPK